VVVISGLILDYYDDTPISGASVLMLSPSGTIVKSGQGSPIGSYELDVASVTGINSYMAYKQGYKALVVTYSGNVSPIVLHLKQAAPGYANSSGTGNAPLTRAAFITSPNIIKVQDTPAHLFCCTIAGLDVIDKNTLNNIAYIPWSGGFTSICLDDRASAVSGIQLGTAGSGVLEFKIPSFDELVNKNISSLLKTKYRTNVGQGLTSNVVQCLDRSYRSDILVGTLSGVDYYNPTGNRFSHEFDSEYGVTACAVSDNGDVYYSPTNSGLYVKYGPITSGWSSPDYKVEVGGVYPFPMNSNIINDIKVSSISGANIVFLATRAGLLCYTEDRGDLNVSASGAKLFNKIP
jgi:hypothetical protein